LHFIREHKSLGVDSLKVFEKWTEHHEGFTAIFFVTRFEAGPAVVTVIGFIRDLVFVKRRVAADKVE
jgi:hypothetical protein